MSDALLTGVTPLLAAAGGLQRADLDDLIKGLVILLIFFGPALKKILESVTQAATRARTGQAPGRPSPSASPRSPRDRPKPSPRNVTWEDLMRGNLPEPVEDAARTVELPAYAAATEAPAPLAGPDAFSDIPDEGQLEREGAAGASLETALGPAWDDAQAPAGLGVLEAGEVQGHAPGDTLLESLARRAGRARSGPVRPGTRLAQGRHWLRPEDWRRSIALAEVLGPPLAALETLSHPGPPGALR